MVSLSLHNPYVLASRLTEEGAVLTLPGVPLVRHLVGAIEWVTDCEAAFLTVSNELGICPHYVRFDRLSVHAFGVCLERAGDVVAALTSIDRAGLAAPEEFRTLWLRWQSSGATLAGRWTPRPPHVAQTVGGPRTRFTHVQASL